MDTSHHTPPPPPPPVTNPQPRRRGPTPKQQQARKLIGGRNAGLRLAADTIVDNNADLSADYPNAKAGGFGEGAYTARWGETSYIQRGNEWIEIQPKETVLIDCDRSLVAPSFSLSAPARAIVGWTEDTRPISKGVTSFADQNLTYPVTAGPDVVREEGFVPATTKQRNAALAEQLDTFGTTKPGATGAIRGCDIGKPVYLSNKKQIKSREQDRALSAAFAPRALRPNEQISHALRLDTNHDSDWTPSSGDYLTELSEAEQEAIQQEATQYRLELLFRTITDRQRTALLLAAEGKTTREIGAEIGVSQPAVVKLLNKARATAKSIGLVR